MLFKLWRGLLREPWMALSRRLTLFTVRRQTRRGQRRQTPYEPVPGRLLYVPASALPYHIRGSTTRTHGIIRAIPAAGADFCVATPRRSTWARTDRRAESTA